MRRWVLTFFIGICATSAHGSISQSAWTPIFVGVDEATGLMTRDGIDPRDQRVNVIRVDLLAPGISFYSTAAGGPGETTTETTRAFMENNKAQVAINANFWAGSNFYARDNVNLVGLAISKGDIVSPAQNGFDASLLITGDNHAALVSAGEDYDLAGIYTAVTGSEFILQNGTVTGSSNSADVNPRTGIGLSADQRYLLLLTIDGRQPGISDGATFAELGDWLLRFGASDGINLDGGGSTTLARDDGTGHALLLNVPSGTSDGLVRPGTERWDGNHLGVFASPVPEPSGMVLVLGLVGCAMVWRKRSAARLRPLNWESELIRQIVTLD